MKYFILMLLSFSVYADPITLTSRGIDHVGITVPNAKEAINFFVSTFGCTPQSKIGPYILPHSMSNDRKTKVPPRAKSMSLWMLDCGPGSSIEVFEYENSKGKIALSDHEDLNGHHVAFYVEDIQKAVANLKTKGLTIIGEPMTMTSGDTAGETWVHFMAPWGLEMELVESPNGKAIQKTQPNPKLAIEAHFKSINELNQKARVELFKKAYLKQVKFVDPYFVVTGHEPLMKMYDKLHEKFPDHKFIVIGKPEVLAGSARVKWNLVGKDGKVVHTGEDFIILRNGQVAELYAFIDGHNYGDNSYENHK